MKRYIIIAAAFALAIPAAAYQIDVTASLQPATPDFITFYDFEANDGGFTMVDGNGVASDNWEWTTATYAAGPPGNGTMWWRSNTDSYTGTNEEFLYTPMYDASTWTACTLWWQGAHMLYDASAYYDCDYTPDGGTTWINVVHYTADGNTLHPEGPYVLTGLIGQPSVQIRWHLHDIWGYGALVDDVMLENGVSLTHDVGVDMVYEPFPGWIDPGLNFNPQARAGNFGANTESFNFILYIEENSIEVYRDTFAVSNLAAGDTVNHTFDPFVIGAAGTIYDFVFYTDLVGDVAPSNDTMWVDCTAGVFCWTTLANAPVGHTGSQQSWLSPDGVNWYVYEFGGNSGASADPNVYRYTPSSNTWETLGGVTNPHPVSYGGSAVVNNVAYLVGGYGAAVDNYFQSFDPLTNTFTPLAVRPVAASDPGLVVYNDSILYSFGGMTVFWSGQTNACHYYNINQGTWTAATSMPVPTGAHGNTIDYATGTLYSFGGIQGGALINTVYEGVVNPANYANVTWTTGAAYLSTIYRNSGWTSQAGSSGPAYSAFGDPAGGSNTGAAYSYDGSTWTVLDVCPVSLSNRMAPAVDYTTGNTYFVGGYNGTYPNNADKFTCTVIVGVDDGPAALPTEVALHAAYPNPFNPTTTIAFDLLNASHVRIDIYNVLGQHITTLVDGSYTAGSHNVVWDASSVGSGIYFARMIADNYSATTKMTLLK